jgi:hypothetical protein
VNPKGSIRRDLTRSQLGPPGSVLHFHFVEEERIHQRHEIRIKDAALIGHIPPSFELRHLRLRLHIRQSGEEGAPFKSQPHLLLQCGEDFGSADGRTNPRSGKWDGGANCANAALQGIM